MGKTSITPCSVRTHLMQVTRKPKKKLSSPSEDWTSLSHEVNLPASVAGANEIKLYLEVSPSSNFDLDNVSLEEADNGGTDDWEEEADARIDILRKRNLTLEVVMPKGTTYDQLVMEVTQRGHNFPFGTAVKSSRLADCWDAGNGSQPVNDAYCSFVGENFNWIVDTYRMKWKAGEPSQGQIETEVEPKCPFMLRPIKNSKNFHFLPLSDS